MVYSAKIHMDTIDGITNLKNFFNSKIKPPGGNYPSFL